jgi:hypothetical protein
MKNFGFNLTTLTALSAVAALSGCGQSRVEYKKEIINKGGAQSASDIAQNADISTALAPVANPLCDTSTGANCDPANPTNPTNAEGPTGTLVVVGPSGTSSNGAADPLHPENGSGNPIVGPVGPTGIESPAGATGVAAPSGAEGATGVAAPSGAEGPTGIAAPSGAEGPTGIAAPSGAEGPTGIAAPSGAEGPTGVAAPSGAEGPTGVAAPSGAEGPTGVAAPSGAEGPTGVAAPSGAESPKVDPTVDPEENPNRPVYVRARPMVSSTIPANQAPWQRWISPRKRAEKLSTEEFEGLGDFADNSTSSEDEEVVTLSDKSVQRCVFRNRLLEGLGDSDNPGSDAQTVLPPPFGNVKLFCVKDIPGIHSEVKLALKRDDLFVNVRWMGSTGTKVIYTQGRREVQFKLSSRISYRQAFGKATKSAIQDDMDVLLNSAMSMSNAVSCALERALFLSVIFEDGQPVSAKIIARTRHFSMHEFEDSFIRERKAIPLAYWHTDFRLPPLNVRAMQVCQTQHTAWVYCAKDGDKTNPNCDPVVTNAVEKNFRPLLEARTPGFATNRVFALKRSEANGEGPGGALMLWHDPEVVGSNAMGYNPLSLEDFEEMTDVIDLGVSKL